MNHSSRSLLRKLRKIAASQQHAGPLVSRTVYTDLHSLFRTGRSWQRQAQATPRELVIETTNICNANCIFCGYQYQDQFRPTKGVMSDEVFEKGLADYAEMKGITINFTPLVGDALVDPNIIKRIRRAKEFGFRVYFYTNGILLNRIDRQAFLETGVDRVLISTSPFDRESHETLYRTKKYDELLEGVHQLLKLREEGRYEVEINISFRSSISLAETLAKPDFQQYILPYLTEQEVFEIDALVRRFDNWGGLIRSEDLVGNMQLARAPKLKHRPCRWTFVLMLLYDGKVRACSCRFTGQERASASDGLEVGDIREETLAEIWQGKRLQALRQSFPSRTIPAVCKSCSLYQPA